MYCQSQKPVEDDETVESEEINIGFSLICIYLTAMSSAVVFLPWEFCIIVHGLNGVLSIEYFCSIQLQL